MLHENANVWILFFIQLLQRAEELENLRKDSYKPSTSKSAHEQAVDQYVGYVATQMYQIPPENWFRFTIDNANMIQSYITRRPSRISGPDVPLGNTVSPVHHDASQAHALCSSRQPSASVYSPALVSSTSPQLPQGSYTNQALLSPMMSQLQPRSIVTTMSPSAYLSLASASFPSISNQEVLNATTSGITSNMMSVDKQSTSTRDASTSENTTSDVMSFSDQFFQ